MIFFNYSILAVEYRKKFSLKPVFVVKERHLVVIPSVYFLLFEEVFWQIMLSGTLVVLDQFIVVP